MHAQERYWFYSTQTFVQFYLIADSTLADKMASRKGITTNVIASVCKGRDLTGVLDLLRRKMELRHQIVLSLRVGI